jgi:hypothetical protein
LKKNSELERLARTSEDWFPYCDGKVYSQQADLAIEIFDEFS